MLLFPAIAIGNPDGNAIFGMLIAAIAGFFLITGMRRKQRERTRAVDHPPVPRTLPAPLESKERLRRDLGTLIGELQDLSRKISAEIDTRFAKLEAAIRDADRRIAVLNRLSRGLADKDAQQSGETQDEDIRYVIVYELSDAGLSPVDIARDLGKTPGEIELILNLRRTAHR